MSSDDELLYWTALHSVPGLGPVTFRRLVDRFGSARTVIENTDLNALSEVRGVTSSIAAQISRSRSRLQWAERTVDRFVRRGVRLVRISDADYPRPLHELLSPPPLLYVMGEIGEEDRRSVGMVGTTKPSPRGRHIAEEFARRFAEAGVTVVSGYAHGIDAASHRGAFQGGGRSVLCLPYGMAHFRSRPDFPPLSEIARRGAVVSERPPDEAWSAAAAVARNRLIAALGAALFVVECRRRGGSFHTVKAAEQLRRPIFALKYQSPPDSARGNAILIGRGAQAVSRFTEIERIIDSFGE